MLLSRLWIAALAVYVLAKDGRGMDGRDGGNGGDNGNDGDDGDDTGSAGASPTGTAAGSSSNSSTPTVSGTGDKICEPYLCVTAVVNGSNVQYLLTSTGMAPTGWMAMGFGSQMADTPMVIMWQNSDGSMTLSQRQAPAEVMPTVVASPPRVATLEPGLSQLSGNTPTYAFSIPANSDTIQDIIWAFGGVNPDSSAVDAQLVMHLLSGPTQLDLTKTLSSSSNSSDNDAAPVLKLPYQYYQKLIIAHGVLMGIGFLVVLPFGALLARYLRTFWPKWFLGHWLAQAGAGFPIILTGFILGIEGVHKSGAPGFNDTHKKAGLALFLIYLFQLFLGALIHFVKPRSSRIYGKRPVQNYGHAVLGLGIIAFGFYQVRNGFRVEWPLATGRGPVPQGIEDAWIVWVVIAPLLYIIGLAFLPRQFSQEKANRNKNMNGKETPPHSPSETTSLRGHLAGPGRDEETEMGRMRA